MQAMRRGDFPRLRTRVEKEGMNYKGYNIAVHELGHNVEQVFSLYDVDHTLLQGVPNNAFTEALAFVFQARDMELLGLGKPDAAAERERVLNDFWATWEIAGVALVDIAVWHWMYEHPDATPAQLREATVAIAKEHWDRYYAPVLGAQGTPLLGIYSHMISYPMYLPDYPLGHLIAFQIEEHLHKKGPAGRGVRADVELRLGDAGSVDAARHGRPGQRGTVVEGHGGRAEAITPLPSGEGRGEGSVPTASRYSQGCPAARPRTPARSSGGSFPGILSP